MPSCCITQCSARKNKNQPNLTLHRFPRNEILKKKWTEAIGSENINPRHKMWHVCSMHFDESCFNKTLDVIRLHDGAVPISTMLPRQIGSSQQLSSSIMIPSDISKAVSSENQNKSDSTCPLKVELPEENFMENLTSVKIQQPNYKIRYLEKKCKLLKQTVRSLNEKVRRRDGKIALLCNIIQDLKRGKFVMKKVSFRMNDQKVFLKGELPN